MTLVLMRLARSAILRQDTVEFAPYISIGYNIRRRAQANGGPTGLPGSGIIFIDMDELQNVYPYPCAQVRAALLPFGALSCRMNPDR